MGNLYIPVKYLKQKMNSRYIVGSNTLDYFQVVGNKIIFASL